MKKNLKVLLFICFFCTIMWLLLYEKSLFYKNEPNINNDLPNFIFVEGDTFVMTLDKSPNICQRKIFVSDYYMSETLITVGQFEKFINETGYKTFRERYHNGEFKYFISQWNDTLEYRFRHENATWRTNNEGVALELNKPVVNVSIDDVYAYCQWLSKVTGKKIELPTDAEWSFAAAGGKLSKKFRFTGTNNIIDIVSTTNIKEMKYLETHPVKQKIKNELGLYDFIGNVYQMVADDGRVYLYDKMDSFKVLINPGRYEFHKYHPFELDVRDSIIVNIQDTQRYIRGKPGFKIDNLDNRMFPFSERDYEVANAFLITKTVWSGSEFIGFRVVLRNE